MSLVRVSEASHRDLKELSTTKGVPMQTVIENAIEAYRRQTFIEGLNSDFAALRANAEAWSAETEERELWANTLADGQEPA